MRTHDENPQAALADELMLAMAILDLAAADSPQNMEWILRQQGGAPDAEQIERSLPGPPPLVARILARFLSATVGKSEANRLDSVLRGPRAGTWITNHPGNPGRFSLRSGAKAEAMAYAGDVLGAWEGTHTIDPNADAPSLLRYLLRESNTRSMLEDLRERFFPKWPHEPVGGVSLAELRSRHESIRLRRLDALIELMQQRDWIVVRDGSVSLTEQGLEEALRLPEEWR